MMLSGVSVQLKLLGLILACAIVSVTSSQATDRALVIGIGNYQNLESLQNPEFDAASVAAKLEAANYDVTRVGEDKATRTDLLAAWGAFLKTVQVGDSVVVYYSGHGIEVTGQNFIVPSDAPDPGVIGAPENLPNFLISFHQLYDNLKAIGAATQVWIIDACRSNPFVENGKAIGSSIGGLARDEYQGAFTFYAASPGQIAADRLPTDSGKVLGSPFTRVFVSMFDDWKAKNIVYFAEQLRVTVLKSVVSQSNNPQFPVYSSGLAVGEYCFITCNAGLPNEEPGTTADASSTVSNDDLATAITAFVKTITAPATDVASVYLGKYSAKDCQPGTVADAYPFGCDAIRKIADASGGNADFFPTPITDLMAATEVNVRARLPSAFGNQLVYSCVARRLKPGEEITITAVAQYNLAQDSYFFGAVNERELDCSDGGVP